MISQQCTTCADVTSLRLSLPGGSKVASGVLNSRKVVLQIENVEMTAYATTRGKGRGVYSLQLVLA